MWHWLRKSVLETDPLIRVSVAVSSGVHLALILGMVISYLLTPTQQISIFQHASITKEVTIIIDPHAPVTGVVMQKGLPKAGTSVPSGNNQTVLAKNELKKPATTMVAEKKVAPARAKKQSKPASKKRAPKQKKQPAKPAKKVQPKSKKEVPKKIVKKESKKVVPEKPLEVASKPAEAQKVEQPVTQVPQQEALPTVPQGVAIPEGIEGPIMIARSAADAAGLAVQLEIQEALLAVWHPPVGIEEGVSCQIRVQLKSDGTLQSLEIVKPSGMMLFDVSARAAIQKTVWPRAVWGTTLELCLQ